MNAFFAQSHVQNMLYYVFVVLALIGYIAFMLSFQQWVAVWADLAWLNRNGLYLGLP